MSPAELLEADGDNIDEPAAVGYLIYLSPSPPGHDPYRVPIRRGTSMCTLNQPLARARTNTHTAHVLVHNSCVRDIANLVRKWR